MKTIKFNNKFSKSRYSFQQRLCIHASDWLLEAATKLPKFQGGLIHSLQIIDEHRKKDMLSVTVKWTPLSRQ